jgi:hypothetical protein
MSFCPINGATSIVPGSGKALSKDSFGMLARALTEGTTGVGDSMNY